MIAVLNTLSMEDNVILKAKELSVEIDGALILEKMNLDVYAGELLGIIGLSGSGKTTLLSSLIGVFEPLTGDVYFSHTTKDNRKIMKSVNSLKEAFRQKIGFSSQLPSFYSSLTVIENLKFFASFYNLDKYTQDERIKILLDLFDLYLFKDKIADSLSGGMKRRLDIACAMINNPKILILDEPTGDLDPILKKQLWYLIKKINQKGTTVVLASHLVSDLELLCDRIVILADGKILKIGTPLELKSTVLQGEKIILESIPGNYTNISKEIESNNSVSSIITEGQRLVIYAKFGAPVLKSLLPILEKLRERVIEISMSKPSLDEIFENIVGKS
jgi:ABC-2 type transport system ATP-binding protein